MIFLYLLPLYLAVGFYLLIRVFHWTRNFYSALNAKKFKIPFGILFLLAMLSPLIAFFAPKNKITIWIRRFSSYWMGILLYFLMAVAIVDLIRLLLKRTRLSGTRLFTRRGVVCVGLCTAIAISSVCSYGLYNARNIKTTAYNVNINKSCKDITDLKVCLVADLHMGYAIGIEQITQMVEKINAENPDLVVIAGDIFDNNFDSLDDPDGIAKQFASINSKYGVYATYGNHDINEKILMGFTFGDNKNKQNDERMNDFLEKSNITLLQDEVVLVDEAFYLVGRRDFEKPSTDDGSRLSADELTDGLDKTKPIFFIDHEPSELQETADAGADIDFSGHTHDGQLFPGTLTVAMLWENPCGMIKKDSMYSIVTSGVGVFGPFMRVGTDSEICIVNVHFNN